MCDNCLFVVVLVRLKYGLLFVSVVCLSVSLLCLFVCVFVCVSLCVVGVLVCLMC